jgi:hypothetical protein
MQWAMNQHTFKLSWSFFQKANEEPEESSEKLSLVNEDDAPKRQARIVCAQCGQHLSTRDQLFAYDGQSMYGVFINPFGVVFELCTLVNAMNLTPIGELTEEGTWFEDYSWQICVCNRCHIHLGWLYQSHTSTSAPSRFYGLIRSKLRES